ncbi:MAG: hypothetical protein A3G15_02355 [Candidatus Levybacteria bacterium RIFCSPLOWO2_12_FULL_40_10]|nr:MAG: hypothetical protein A3G15_02355 [Candidatus Levybacteria bacterium RIFCSPLOWO2_12_FULL_40_10]
MKILITAAEVAPYVSVGGLSQVMYFLPRSLAKKGHSVRIFTAKYGEMDKTSPDKKPWRLREEFTKLQIPDIKVRCSISSFIKRGSPKAFFLENKEYFELRANVFGYKDDHMRFALLSKGCLEWLSHLKKSHDPWWPDIIHANDWHTGYFIDMARRNDRYKSLLLKTPIVFTVHNFSFQGNINFRYLTEKKRDDGTKPLEGLTSSKLIMQNALLRGIINADAVNTVSQTHAIEVLDPEYGEGLDTVLNRVRGKLTGILNGLDTKEFNPATDPIIKNNYSARNFVPARKKNKLALQKEFGLVQDASRPLIAVSGRISTQKGWDLILEVLPRLLSEKKETQFLVMGQGDEHYQNELLNLAKQFPEQLALHLQTDFKIPRRIYSGADMILLPSIFEPGGIVALEALRYGTVPIVRRTGGLNDIIRDFNPNRLSGNGFSFTNKSPWSLFATIITALSIYNQPSVFKRLVKNCLKSDFSWDHAANEYLNWYEKVIEVRRRATSTTPHPAYKPELDERVDFA